MLLIFSTSCKILKSSKDKINLLFLNYLEGVPNPDIGGPNHVIYDFLNNCKDSKFILDFLSYGTYINQINYLNLSSSNEFMLGTKKVTHGLYYRNSLFRAIVSNDYYKPFHFWKHNYFFNKHLPQKEYDIIHAHDSIGLSFTKNCRNSKRIMTIHHHIPYSLDMTIPIKNQLIKQRIFKNLRKREFLAYELSDVITFPSLAVKNFYLSEINPNKERDIRIIYNGVDIEKINLIPKSDIQKIISMRKSEYDLIILSVASHGKEKNLHLALETIGRMVHFYRRNVLFINCGIGNQTDQLKNLSVKLGIEKNVLFLGAVANKEVIGLMKACDIFLHLSDKVVFDLVVLEAMACGLCVIASNNGGNKELITDEDDGYLVNSVDPNKIANLILKAQRERVGKNTLKTIQKYSLNNYVKAYSQLYTELGWI